jgi:hypothetical protein
MWPSWPTTSFNAFARTRRPEFAPPPDWIARVSMLPLSRSMSPARLSVSFAAVSEANPASLTAPRHLSTPAAPSEYRIDADRIASLPKICPSAWLRCSSVRSFIRVCKICATPDRPTNLPCAS